LAFSLALPEEIECMTVSILVEGSGGPDPVMCPSGWTATHEFESMIPMLNNALMGHKSAQELFQQLGCDVVPLFCTLDGRFPNHAPDPSVPGNLRQLIAEVAARGADIGIAFDGDADRLGIVTGAGRIITADRLMMIFARDLLAHQPGADVVFDVKCSRDLASVISSHGGRPIMWRSGHAWIKQKMQETGALLGGEFTGHVCFRDRWFGFDDGLYAAARLLEILSAEDSNMDAQLAGLPQTVSTPELMIPVPENEKFDVMERIEEKMMPPGSRLNRIDGVRAEFSDGWGLVRASNTSAALGCRFEAESEAALARIKPGVPGTQELFVVTFAGFGSEDVFMRESLAAGRVLKERFGAEGDRKSVV
jgi:phosphomannomutase/phosphoglucomutase